MDTPGNILRSEREKQNKSLNGIAKSLKISIEYLDAIEADKYDLLPAEVYTKAYIRLYAESLGLESDYILSLYKIEPETSPIQEPEPPLGKKPFNYKLLLITAAISIIILTVMLSTHREQEPAMEVAGETAEPVTDAEKKPDKLSPKIAMEQKPVMEVISETAEPGKPPPEFTREQKPVMEVISETAEPGKLPPEFTRKQEPVMEVISETAEPGIVPGKKPDKLSLKITAIELTWISVSIDGSSRREWPMRAGESTTLTASEKFSITIGNAGGTRLIFNDEDLGELGPRGKVADIVLP